MDATSEQNTTDLVVTKIRRRKDGLFLIESRDEVVLSLSRNQMMIVLAVVNAESGHDIRRGIRNAIFPNRPRMRLKHSVREDGEEVDSVAVPMTPSERATLSRTIRRLVNLGLIETHGRKDIQPTESAIAIARWLDDHEDVLSGDDGMLKWVSRHKK